MSACPDPALFVAIFEKRAPATDAEQAVLHVLTCTSCAARWDEVRKNAQTLATLGDAGDLLHVTPPRAEAIAAPITDPMLGRVIEGYRVKREVGRGARGAVYEAIREGTGLRCAIKALVPEHRHLPGFHRRFRAEGRAASLVRHPGLVTIFNYGHLPEGTAYILMEYLDGPSLRERMELQAQPGAGLPLEQALRTARQIASALCALHRRGIVHRDLKPANVMIVPDVDLPAGERAVVVDFGIAKFDPELSQSSSLEGSLDGEARFVGTPAYASPEQCRMGDEVDCKSDVYALGIMIYEMLTGARPFAGPTPTVLGMHMHAQPRPLREQAPGLPAAVQALVHEMLAKEPADRPSAAQVRDRLDRLLSDREAAAGVHVGWLVGAGLALAGAAAALLHLVGRL